MDNRPFQDMLTDGGVRIAIVGVAAILSLFLLAQTVTIVQDFGRPSNPATDTITVSADGQATMPPDVARISFTVQNTASNVADAQAATTKQANATLDFVKQQGVADKDVRTTSYTITPQYAYPQPCVSTYCPVDRSPKITGYQVAESVEVTVRDLSKVGDLLAGLGKLSVQNVSGPDFTLDDTTAGYDAARADAITKAKAQATMLAQQLGVRLGSIVNFSESSGYRAYPMVYGMGGADTSKASATPSVPTGENTYTASVSVTYEIR